jgi:hypothetical protein
VLGVVCHNQHTRLCKYVQMHAHGRTWLMCLPVSTPQPCSSEHAHMPTHGRTRAVRCSPTGAIFCERFTDCVFVRIPESACDACCSSGAGDSLETGAAGFAENCREGGTYLRERRVTAIRQHVTVRPQGE